MRPLALAALLFACRQPTPAQPPRPAPPPAPAPAAASTDQLRCLDDELRRRGLNEFGDPPGTMYAGGTPLFDEKTGKTSDRAAYLRLKHPEVGQACPTH